MERPMFCLVINRIVCSYCIVIIIVCIVGTWCLVGLINSSKIIETHCMNKTCYRHILIFQPFICRIIPGYIFLLQVINAKTFRLFSLINGIVQHSMTCSIIRFFLILYTCIKFFFIKGLTILFSLFYGFLSRFINFLCFLRFNGKLFSFYFFLRHWNFSVESQTITMVKEDVFVVVSIPVL